MPGIFGGVGCPPALYEALRADFAATYGKSEAVHTAGGMLGGHAFGSRSALHVAPGGGPFAVDGELAIYRRAEAFARDRACATSRPAAGCPCARRAVSGRARARARPTGIGTSSSRRGAPSAVRCGEACPHPGAMP